MEFNIKGFILDKDEEYKRHEKVLLACYDANISLPTETMAYFGSANPKLKLLDDKLKVELIEGEHYTKFQYIPKKIKEWCSGLDLDNDAFLDDDEEIGFDVDISKLPKGVSKIRFFKRGK